MARVGKSMLLKDAGIRIDFAHVVENGQYMRMEAESVVLLAGSADMEEAKSFYERQGVVVEVVDTVEELAGGIDDPNE